MMEQQLFDLDGPVPVTDPPQSHRLAQSEWLEVPQARFDSWSLAMQRAYCARRDEDSAAYAESDAWKQFYLERAAWYRKNVTNV